MMISFLTKPINKEKEKIHSYTIKRANKNRISKILIIKYGDFFYKNII
jgi:hypothetical protein